MSQMFIGNFPIYWKFLMFTFIVQLVQCFSVETLLTFGVVQIFVPCSTYSIPGSCLLITTNAHIVIVTNKNSPTLNSRLSLAWYRPELRITESDQQLSYSSFLLTNRILILRFRKVKNMDMFILFFSALHAYSPLILFVLIHYIMIYINNQLKMFYS